MTRVASAAAWLRCCDAMQGQLHAGRSGVRGWQGEPAATPGWRRLTISAHLQHRLEAVRLRPEEVLLARRDARSDAQGVNISPCVITISAIAELPTALVLAWLSEMPQEGQVIATKVPTIQLQGSISHLAHGRPGGRSQR
jgi:hypothetical protein